MINIPPQHHAYEPAAGNSDQYALQIALIREMQTHQGDEACFATEKSQDCAKLCQWRRNCRKLTRTG